LVERAQIPAPVNPFRAFPVERRRVGG
jgi:hypothetical protein